LLGSWGLSLIWDPLWFRKIQAISAVDLTVVYGFNHHLLDRVSRFNPKLKRKVATVVQGSAKPETFHASGLSLPWAVDVLSQSDYLIFASARTQKVWLSFPPLADKPSFYIPNTCPQEGRILQLLQQDKSRLRERLGLPKEVFIAVCVGSVQPRKGQDLLLKYFDDFRALDADVHLYLIGPDHVTWAQDLRGAIAESAHTPYFHMLGSRSNALEYLRAADLFILPSRAEAMPLAILEAMALKTPVIASDVDGIPELIQHKVTGLLFSHSEPEGLVMAFRQIASQPDWATQLADNAHQRYWEYFSRAQQFRRYHEVLNSMVV
jgi:glycosyltransferase involved in cell wall biosynthesis